MKRFACFALVIVLSLAVQPLIYCSDAQSEPEELKSMDGTIWAVHVLVFQWGTGKLLARLEDTFEFQGGTFHSHTFGRASYQEIGINQRRIKWSAAIEIDPEKFYIGLTIPWCFEGTATNWGTSGKATCITSGVGMLLIFWGSPIESVME